MIVQQMMDPWDRVCGHQRSMCGLSRLLRLYGTTRSSALIQFHKHRSPPDDEANTYWSHMPAIQRKIKQAWSVSTCLDVRLTILSSLPSFLALPPRESLEIFTVMVN